MNKSYPKEQVSGLNPAQERAACHKEGAMLVLAGPGSGKTHVITKRLQYLVEKCHVPPERILVITFTKAAAREMQRRSIPLCQSLTKTAFGTFHSVFYHIIHKSNQFKHFQFLTEPKKQQIQNRITQNLSLHRNSAPLNGAASPADEAVGGESAGHFDWEEFEKRLSYLKNTGGCYFDGRTYRLKQDEFFAAADRGVDERFEQAFAAYTKICLEEGCMDFDDVLCFCRELLLHDEKERRQWQERFDYILIDEFQDINAVQYEIISLLAGKKGNLFVVGDDDQAIYGFRGSDPGFMRRFLEDFHAGQCVLNANYRCAQEIVRLSSHFITHNEQRFAKELRAAKEEAGKVSLLAEPTAQQQKKTVQSQITQCLKKGESVAVLLRTNEAARSWQKIFLEHSILHERRTKEADLLDTGCMRDVLALFRFLYEGQKRADFLVFMNKPERLLMRESIPERVDLDALQAELPKESEVYERVKKLARDVEFIKKLDAFGAIQYFLYQMGYRKYLLQENRQGELEKLQRLLEYARPFSDGSALLRQLALQGSLENMQNGLANAGAGSAKTESTEKVQIMTYHGAKGLEFDHVFLPDVNRGSVPLGNFLTPEALEEERRMFYVAMTRAKKELVISYVKDEQSGEGELSEFILELLEI